MSMLPSQPIEENRRLSALGLSAYTSTFGDVMGATAEEAWATNPTVSAWQLIKHGAAKPGPVGVGAEFGEEGMGPAVESERMLRPDEANESYGIDKHLTFKESVPASVAKDYYEAKRRELARKDVISRSSEGGAGQVLSQFGVGLGVSILDPLNVASAFIPVVGPTRYAMALEKAGSAAGRAAVRTRMGAVEGAVGALAVEPLILAATSQRQADYDGMDSLLNVAFGTVLGGGLHAGLGHLGDVIARRGMAEPMLKAAVAAVAEDRPVEVAMPFLSPLRLAEPERALPPSVATPVRESGAEMAAALSTSSDPVARELGAHVARLSEAGTVAARAELAGLLPEIEAARKGLDVPGVEKMKAALASDVVEAAKADALRAVDVLAKSEDADARELGKELAVMISRGADATEIEARLADLKALTESRPQIGRDALDAVRALVTIDRDSDLIRLGDQIKGLLKRDAGLERIGEAAGRLAARNQPQAPTPEMVRELKAAEGEGLRSDERPVVQSVEAAVARAASAPEPAEQIKLVQNDITELETLIKQLGDGEKIDLTIGAPEVINLAEARAKAAEAAANCQYLKVAAE